MAQAPCFPLEPTQRSSFAFSSGFGASREGIKKRTPLEFSMIMDQPFSYRNIYGRADPEPLGSRPTLPSLRSQVGEYLHTPPLSSLPDFHHPYYQQEARTRNDANSRRLSISSSVLSQSGSPGSSVTRTPSADGRRRASPSTLNADGRRRASPSTLNAPNFHATHRLPSPGISSLTNARPPPFLSGGPPPPVAATRTTVSVACTNCRSAHLACSDGRPCRRCLQTGRAATCIDVEPKKRGRPRASDTAQVATTTSMMQNLSTEPSGATGLANPERNEPVIIMSTSLRCARLTPAVQDFLGHSPKAMLEQPLSTFIHPDEKPEYARFSLRMLAYPGVASRPVPVSATRLHQTPIPELTTPLFRGESYTHTFRLRTAAGAWMPFKFESYLGSAFGAHPKDTYVVVKLMPVGIIAGSGGNHCSPTSQHSSPHSLTGPSRGRTSSMSYYAPGPTVSGSSSRSTSQARDPYGSYDSQRPASYYGRT